MKDQVDQVLKLSREILKLERQERGIRHKRDLKKAELARLLAGEGVVPTRVAEFRPGSMTARVAALLLSKYPESMTAEAIANALGTDAPSVRSTLSRLKTADQIESPNRGEYRAVHHEEEKTEGGEEDIEDRREQSP
ncbi:MAG TPA: hypothetical protein VIF83_07930 [Gemmatimonadaceae bacterium]|jgi:hypothetical protein